MPFSVKFNFVISAKVSVNEVSSRDRIFDGTSFEKSENKSDRLLAELFGIEAGMPENSRLKMSLFPVLSLVMLIPLRFSGLVIISVVVSDLDISALPEMLFSALEIVKSIFAVYDPSRLDDRLFLPYLSPAHPKVQKTVKIKIKKISRFFVFLIEHHSLKILRKQFCNSHR